MRHTTRCVRHPEQPVMSAAAAVLRKTLLETLASGVPRAPLCQVGNRPVFLLAPNSDLGKRYIPLLTPRLANTVAVVDDYSSASELFGIPRWSLFRFVQEAAKTPDAIAIDFSVGRFSTALFARAATEARVPRIDFVAALGEFNLPAVYESAGVVRARTFEHIERFLALDERFADDLSRATLYAFLLLRLNFDRTPLQGCLLSGEHEYFSAAPTGSTFQLAPDEVFCDAGAHTGTVTCKFLGATGWQYRAIHAFEPDRVNYAALGKMRLLPLHDFHIRNRALSDNQETLSFVECGNVSSHIGSAGAQTCQTVRLDDELEELTFLKMDIEGFETRALRGARRLIGRHMPRMAITAYHYALDLPDIVDLIDELHEGYVLRLRHHYNFYYDTILYASRQPGWEPDD